MKLSKEELKKKISELEINEDIAIELLEDIEDSFVENSDDLIAYKEILKKYEDIKKKYKERFLNSESEIEKKEFLEDDGLVEKKEIDIKEI